MNEPRDLFRTGGTVRIEHHHYVAARSSETLHQGAALAHAVLVNDLNVGAQCPCHLNSRVAGVTVDEDDFVDLVGNLDQNVWEVRRLVCRRDDHAKEWLARHGARNTIDGGRIRLVVSGEGDSCRRRARDAQRNGKSISCHLLPFYSSAMWTAAK